MSANFITKGRNNEVFTQVELGSSTNRRRRLVARVSCQLSARDHAVAQSWVRPTRELGIAEAGAITLGLLLAVLVFAGVNALTGEAQETQAGHASAWQGPKLHGRVQWGAR